MKINAIGHLVKANPIQSQSNPISKKPKMNVNSLITKDYRKNDAFAVQKNKPKQSQPVVSLSNLFQTLPCKNGSSRMSTVEVISLECTIGHYGKVFAG